MRIVFALLFIFPLMAMAAPAWAQGKRHNADASAAKPEDRAKKKAEEEAYQRALKSIPEPKGKIDPWAGSR